MSIVTERKRIAGDIYVVTNDCFRKVQALGRYKGRGRVAPVKIGRGVEFANRVGSLSAAVFDEFIVHIVLHSEDSVQSESDLHEYFGDSRILTEKLHSKTEFFAVPLEDMLKRVRKYVKHHDLVVNQDFGIKGQPLGSSACSIKATLERRKEAKKKRAASSLAKKAGSSSLNWSSPSQLASLIAQRAGRPGSHGHIQLMFADKGSKNRRRCPKTSEWRKPLEDAGVKFDKNDYVSNWKCAKNPL